MQTGSRPRTWGWGLILTGLAISLCFVPLFNLLGFEFCFALGLVAAFAGAHLGSVGVWEARRGLTPSEGASADARPLGFVLRLYCRCVARVWILLLCPLFAITLNAVRVRNCSFVDGLLWFFLLPISSSVCGVCAGVACGLALDGRRRVWPTLLAYSVVLGSIVWAGVRFYATPAIFAYDPFGGYFPGTPYDEEVAATHTLLWARVYHVSLITAVLLCCALVLDGPRLRLTIRAGRGRRSLAFAALLGILVAYGLHTAHARLGFFLDAGDVAKALGATRESEHFVLHYSPAGPFEKDIALHVADHEFRYAQLKKLFGVEPPTKVHSFLFDSAQQKQALMGAGHTFVAKPWRREIYLQSDGWPHPVLMHELAHVFGGVFGDPIFGASRRGLAFNVGLIEGVAVAAAWQGGALTPHQAVKSMRGAGFQPPLEQVMSVRFLGLNASQAYNVAGSFCRYLLDKSGPKRLENVFREGGIADSYQEQYGVSFDNLAAEWSQFIDRVEVPPAESAVIRERLRRPSVFHKVCAHELALKRERAQRAVAANDRESALAELAQVCADDSEEPQNVADLMDAANAADRPDEASRAAQRLLEHPRVTAVLRARAYSLLGDLAFQRDQLDAAARSYEQAENLPLEESAARLVTVKRLACREPRGPIAVLLKRFLASPQMAHDPALAVLTVSELVHLAPERALFHYLLARQLEMRGRFLEASDELDAALAPGRSLPDARFVREALRLLGRSRFRAGQLDLARVAFEQLAKDPNEPVRLEAQDWIARCEFRL